MKNRMNFQTIVFWEKGFGMIWMILISIAMCLDVVFTTGKKHGS